MEGFAKQLMGDAVKIHAPFTTIPAMVPTVPQLHSHLTGTVHFPYKLIAPRKPVTKP